MFSKTQLNKRIQRKNNPELVETLIACKKAGGDWMKVGKILSGSKRNLPSINLEEINEKSSEGDTIVVPGKVLSQGNIDKKLKIVALGFSESSKEKIKERGIENALLIEEIKSNQKAEGIRILGVKE